ncbi:hypothetical protein Trydic_g9067, partial [Trypoxylus dichotomus]
MVTNKSVFAFSPNSRTSPVLEEIRFGWTSYKKLRKCLLPHWINIDDITEK